MSREPDDEIILDLDQFWIVRRRRLFGPFDYQWSSDLYGIELTYRGEKFGEVCGEDEVFADLKPFRLPITVARVATLTAGALIAGIRAGTCRDARVAHLLALLQEHRLQRFRVREAQG